MKELKVIFESRRFESNYYCSTGMFLKEIRYVKHPLHWGTWAIQVQNTKEHSTEKKTLNIIKTLTQCSLFIRSGSLYPDLPTRRKKEKQNTAQWRMRGTVNNYSIRIVGYEENCSRLGTDNARRKKYPSISYRLMEAIVFIILQTNKVAQLICWILFNI